MSTSRFVVEDLPMYDSNTGKEGGVVAIYSGEARRHPWPSRAGEFVMDGCGVAKLVNGDTYIGEFSLGMRHGNGKMEYVNGDVFDGQWVNNLRHGYGVLDTADGCSYVGGFRNGDKDGTGEEIFADGTTFVGMFRDGKRHGVGRIRVKSSGDVVDGVFSEGRLEGLVTVSYGHGDTFVGRFEAGDTHGEGKYTQVDSGDVYTETFFHGQCIEGVLEPGESSVGDLKKYSDPLPPWLVCRDEPPAQKKQCNVVYAASGDHYVGEWKREAAGSNRRGVRHGFGRLTHASDGAVYEGTFADNLKEGFGILWFPSPQHSTVENSAVPTLSGIESLHADSSNSATSEASGQGAVDARPENEDDASNVVYPVVYRGQFHADLMDGEGSIEYSDGSSTQQFFSKGASHGFCMKFTAAMSFSLPHGCRYRPSVSTSMFERGQEVPCSFGVLHDAA